MKEQTNHSKEMCQAMIDAGIEDPNSAEGILFCTGDRLSGGVESQCPYPYCVVFEHSSQAAKLKAKARKEFAINLHKYGISEKDIALILHLGLATIRRYLRKK